MLGDIPSLPEITLPFPARRSCHSEVITAHLSQWALRNGITQRIDVSGTGYGLLAGYMYPDAHPPLVLAIAEAVAWLFLYDDFLDGDAPPRADAVRGVLRLRSLPAAAAGDVLLGCLAGLAAGPLGEAPQPWWERFAASVEGFADAMAEESEQRCSGYAQGVGQYADLRYWTSGWQMLADLAELSAGGQVPLPARAALVRPAGDVACAVNDLLSFRAELKAGEQHNMIMVLTRTEGGSFAEAVGGTHRWLTRRLDDYLRARTEILHAPGGQACLAFTRALEALMRGSLDWSLVTERYRADRADAGEEQQG